MKTARFGPRARSLILVAGLGAGLACSPAVSITGDRTAWLLFGALGMCAGGLAARGRGAAAPALLFAAAAGAALSAGSVRLEAIDAGALRADPGARVRLRGNVASPLRREREGVSFELSSGHGRVSVLAPAGADLTAGMSVEATGALSEPEPWRERALERRGIAMVLTADSVTPLPGRRGGLTGAIDGIRVRAERVLERGVPDREAALMRGFVLGQDDRIDEATREDFRRSGLAHLLAVSGQNVALLCLLAWPLLALAGLTLRSRLVVLLALVAVYVPVTGAGPSIQRAGVMGAAAIVAALADRPSSRAYALLLAAAATLALNPRASGDVGWQLSFAAVIGILFWTGRLASLLSRGAARGTPQRALAEGAAMTMAATAATAPLMAHHFGALAVGSLPANLLALPAVAPAMWLGMLVSMAGQAAWIPVEPLNWLGSLCVGYIAQVARWFGTPSWAEARVSLPSPWAVAVAYGVLAAAIELALRVGARSVGLAPSGPARRGLRLAAAGAIATAALVSIGPGAAALRAPPPDRAPGSLVVRFLDVGQGDAVLLDPPGGAPVLVDAGPPGAGIGQRLRELGVRSLGAAVVTHADTDHAGGLSEALAAAPAARVVLGAPDPGLRTAAEAAGAQPTRLVEGGEIRSGRLRLSVLWPPGELAARPADPADGEAQNRLSVILLAEWGHLSMLLTGDAEAEAVPLDPGPVDVLKVAHHGSEDAGLGALLDRTAPRVAVIPVGENPYGHPAPETLAELESRPLALLRTDRDGEVVIEADARGWAVAG